MRLGVIDVGSNTVHLLVVDAHPGARPLPATSHKIELRLSENLDSSGAIRADGARRLVTFIRECRALADEQGVEEVLGFVTSAIRESANGDDVLRQVRDEAGVSLRVLSGADEARLTFLAVRRWFGWSSGNLLVIDIGGGSLELAAGLDEEPDVAVSLPLGAGRLTREHLLGDPPDKSDIKALRKTVRASIAREVRAFTRVGDLERVVGTSKTMRSLARIAGAAPLGAGPFVPRTLGLEDLGRLVKRLGSMSAAERAELPGVSPSRAGQLLAGALVAEAAMALLGAEHLDICPWALREGIILRRLDTIVE
jgi:exopolyphosphatase/guanosine-5'-triphosphate,3'-diphosphate pyrophosphatase